MKKSKENRNEATLIITNTDESMEKNKTNITLPSISSILNWHPKHNSSTTALSSSSSSSSFNSPYQINNNSSMTLSSENTLPPLLLSHSSSSSLSSQYNHHYYEQQHLYHLNQQQQQNHHPVNHQYNNNVNTGYKPDLNQAPAIFVFKPKPLTLHNNGNSKRLKRTKRIKLFPPTSCRIVLSGNLNSQQSTAFVSESVSSFQSNQLNNNNNDNNSNDTMKDVIIIDNDNDSNYYNDNNDNNDNDDNDDNNNSDRSMSISSTSSISSNSNTSNPLIKPRWKENERINLLKAIVKEKQLDDMTSFSWDKIALAVGRAKKACKDQWRREVLPAIMKNVK